MLNLDSFKRAIDSSKQGLISVKKKLSYVTNNPAVAFLERKKKKISNIRLTLLAISIVIGLVEGIILWVHIKSVETQFPVYVLSGFCFISLIIILIGVLLQRIKWCLTSATIFVSFAMVYFRLLLTRTAYFYLGHEILSLAAIPICFRYAYLVDRKTA